MLRLYELGVPRDQRQRVVPRLLQGGAVADEVGDTELGKPGLPRAEEIPGSPHREVYLCDLESVIRSRHGVDASPRVRGGAAREQDAVALERSAPHAAP